MKTSIIKAPYYCLENYIVVNDLKSPYYFILRQGMLLFVIGFIIFVRYKTIFIHILIIYFNFPTILSSVIFPSRILNPSWYHKEFIHHKTTSRQFSFYISCNQWTDEQKRLTVDFSQQGQSIVLIQLVSGKIRQFTTLPIQCESLT